MRPIMNNKTLFPFIIALLTLALPSYAELPAEKIDSSPVFMAASYDYYYAEQKEAMVPMFVDTVNKWLRRYKPKLISRGDDKIEMQAEYDILFNIDLNLGDKTYEIDIHPAQTIEDVVSAKLAAAHLVNGIQERVKEQVDQWVIENREELEANAKARREDEQKAAIAEARARMAEIKSKGPLRAYPALASFRYKKCERTANTFLDTDVKKFKTLFEAGLQLIETCAASEEAALGEEVRLALAQSSVGVAGKIKDLHAYTVASLRALTNFHQSAIEARQARAERSAGIDERETRVELEL